MTANLLQKLRIHLAFTLTCLAALAGCAGGSAEKAGNPAATSVRLSRLDLSVAGTDVPRDEQIVLTAAKNESIGFAVQLAGLPTTAGHRLRITSSSGVPPTVVAYQLLSMPLELNRAGFIRHTGLTGGRSALPRALLPLHVDASGGEVDLSTARDPNHPTDPAARPSPGQTLMFWIDLHIPRNAAAGDVTITCEIVARRGGRGGAVGIASLPLKLTIWDFALPDERHLTMASRVDWDSLRRLYPEFEEIEPRLISRMDKQYASPVRVLDQLQKLAQSHRTQLIYQRLQPTVKWPTGKPPEVDWVDYESLVWPWLKGQAFADRVPLSYWPLPAVDFLDNYPAGDRLRYWAEAASHFDQLNWLDRSAVFVDLPTRGRASALDSIRISAEAARILQIHPRLRVTVPLETGQIQLAGESNRQFISPTTAGRLMAAAPGLVSSTPLKSWPTDVPPPQKWLRADMAGVVPYAGAGGDGRDVRLWAWLAFLRSADTIVFAGGLPQNNSPQQPADPNELIWFYPGSWFGINEPVPTLGLKWLRRAEQDYEYLWLAAQRGQRPSAMVMARLVTKPVEIQPNQPEDPTYALMCGTTDAKAWSEATRLLADAILLREPGKPIDAKREQALDIATLRWAKPQERPTLLARSTQWMKPIGQQSPLAPPGSLPAVLRLGIDIYNPSDTRPADNFLRFASVPFGWEIRPQPITIRSLATYRVQRFYLDAKIDPARVVNSDRRPVELTFTNGFDNRATAVKVVIPAAVCDRLPPGLNLNGSLEDWSADDAIQQGPMIAMLNRPAVQNEQVQLASTPSSIYSGWSDENLYVAFKLTGLSQQQSRVTRNFVTYQFRRAWGEDLCQILMQPIYADGSYGPVLHVVCKPNGCWVERKGDPTRDTDPWPAFEGSTLRYYGTIAGQDWRGEVAVPWKAITDDASGTHGRPIMLKFNFTQHRAEIGESASWAGPIDFGRDDQLMGLLFIRDTQVPEMAGAEKR